MTILFGPDEGVFPAAELPLDGCRWCGVITKYEHAQRWSPEVGWHVWTPLTQEQIKERMRARRLARLTAEPYQYHAVTVTDAYGWPVCGDCGRSSCPRWLRARRRLDART